MTFTTCDNSDMDMTTHVWLDLEGTLIKDWWNPDFLYDKARCIRRAIEELQPATINIFSFAIHEPRERKHLRDQWQAGLEKFFGMPFTVVPTVLDFQKSLGQITGLGQLKRNTVLDEWGKFRTFAAMVHEHCDSTYRGGSRENVRCVLFDDDVKDFTLHDRRTNVTAEAVNVDLLLKDSAAWLRENP